MITARWIQPSKDPSKPANMRDEVFASKRELFDRLVRESVSSIRKLPTAGGKLYAISLKSK